jgi:peroxiredoxin
VSSAVAVGEMRHLSDRLVGQPIPPVVLDSFRSPVDLGQFARAFSLVVYLYPGSRSSPDGEDTPRMDGVQHRAFRAHERELMALEFHTIGVSSQSTRSQLQCAQANRLGHRLLSDPQLLLARELGLPTFDADGAWWYRRLMLVVTGGRIAHAFSVRDPARSPAQAIAWTLIHSVRQGAGAGSS